MKIVMVTLGYAPARVIIECFKQVYATVGNVAFEHYVLNNHYPLDMERNDKLIKTLCDSYNCKYFDLGHNVGLAAGYTYLINQANLQDGDIVIGVDPDVNPVTPKFGEALIKVLSDKSQKVGWASLMNQHSLRELQERGHTLTALGGVMCMITHTAVLNSICAWTSEMLRDLGSLKEPNQFYGGFESMTFDSIKKFGYEWVFLPEYREEYNDKFAPDASYRHWKYNYAHLHTTKLDFGSWLAEDPSRLNLK